MLTLALATLIVIGATAPAYVETSTSATALVHVATATWFAATAAVRLLVGMKMRL